MTVRDKWDGMTPEQCTIREFFTYDLADEETRETIITELERRCSLPPPPPADAEAVRLADALESKFGLRPCTCIACKEWNDQYGTHFADAIATIRRLAGTGGA
jgi:hypothetical protein